MSRSALGAWLLLAACAGPRVALDGSLDEKDWSRAPVLGPFTGPFNPGGRDLAGVEEYRSEARMLWDADTLYVGFACRGPDIVSTFANRDDELYREDVAELFLDVAGDMLQISEFQVSPRGVIADYYHTWSEAPTYPAEKVDWAQEKKSRKGEKGWDLAGFRGAAAPLVEGGKTVGWTAEMAVPVAEILRRRGLPPTLSEGRTFRANLLRYAYEPAPGGKRLHRHLNLVRTMKGCPHVSPMAAKLLRCEPGGIVIPAE